MALADLKKRFGAELKRRRMESGMSQEKLAELADLHRTYISAVESGKRNLTLVSIERLAQALGASVASFFAAVEGVPEQTFRGETFVEDAPSNGAILLVEDDPKDVEFTLAAFKTAKLANSVQVTADGETALEMLDGRENRRKATEQALPQLVLLDLHLPGMHGLEVLRRIKSDRRLKAVPVVVLSGSQNDGDIHEAMRLGANAYLIKPLDFHRFAEVTPKLRFRWALL